jgi:2-hydroxychromene-2-carboxylate isomerase
MRRCSSGADRGAEARPIFYFDLASPYAYLAASRVDRLLPQAVWQPILVGALHKYHRRVSWGATPELRARGVKEIEDRAAAYGLASIRWPRPYPANSLVAMRAAIFAQRRGRLREFTQAAFAVAFAEGLDLTEFSNIARAAARVGLEPAEVAAAVASAPVKAALREASDEAIRRRVYGVPTFEVADVVWWGDEQLEAAALHASTL